MIIRLKKIYDRQHREGRYARSLAKEAGDHRFFAQVEEFVARHGLSTTRCLEIGCGVGAFQDLVSQFVGVDISEVAGTFLHKPFICSSATELPFQGESFGAVWSVTTLEHVPEPERALEEMRRVLAPGGFLLLWPAWHCRSWAAEGYAVRPYSDLDWRGKMIKASIPLRNSLPWRAPGVFLNRAVRLYRYLSSRPRPTVFTYRTLRPNYVRNWTSDSDAVNSMDPFEAILWFVSRGDVCVTCPNVLSAFFVRTGGLVFRVKMGSSPT